MLHIHVILSLLSSFVTTALNSVYNTSRDDEIMLSILLDILLKIMNKDDGLLNISRNKFLGIIMYPFTNITTPSPKFQISHAAIASIALCIGICSIVLST